MKLFWEASNNQKFRSAILGDKPKKSDRNSGRPMSQTPRKTEQLADMISDSEIENPKKSQNYNATMFQSMIDKKHLNKFENALITNHNNTQNEN